MGALADTGNFVAGAPFLAMNPHQSAFVIWNYVTRNHKFLNGTNNVYFVQDLALFSRLRSTKLEVVYLISRQLIVLHSTTELFKKL
jgi:hypothetical protein